jgi:hypothetical protein
MKWDKDAVLQVASIFDNMVDFRLAYHGAYRHAVRHGYLEAVRSVVLHRNESGDDVLRKLANALGESRRRFGVAAKIRSIGSWANEIGSDEIGRPLDFDLGQWEQAGEEVEGIALDLIERLQAVGTEAQVAEGWEMYLDHQTNGRYGRASGLTKSPTHGGR